MIELNKIYNESCMETFARMDDESVDLIITSPPYNKNAYATDKGTSGFWSAMRGRQIAYDEYNDAMPPRGVREMAKGSYWRVSSRTQAARKSIL